ncbi:hypothetical protein ABTL87_19445, partial [Acinetobacter baumannii]
MPISTDRIVVGEGERIRAAAFAPNQIDVLASGGVDHLRHELEDIGFRDVVVYAELPSEWPGSETVRRPVELELRFGF